MYHSFESARLSLLSLNLSQCEFGSTRCFHSGNVVQIIGNTVAAIPGMNVSYVYIAMVIIWQLVQLFDLDKPISYLCRNWDNTNNENWVNEWNYT